MTARDVRIRVAGVLREYRTELFAIATQNWEELLVRPIRREDGKVTPFECIADILREHELCDGNLLMVKDVVAGLGFPRSPKIMGLAAGHLNGSGVSPSELVATKLENLATFN
jgi:hypothetical protein